MCILRSICCRGSYFPTIRIHTFIYRGVTISGAFVSVSGKLQCTMLLTCFEHWEFVYVWICLFMYVLCFKTFSLLLLLFFLAIWFVAICHGKYAYVRDDTPYSRVKYYFYIKQFLPIKPLRRHAVWGFEQFFGQFSHLVHLSRYVRPSIVVTSHPMLQQFQCIVAFRS